LPALVLISGLPLAVTLPVYPDSELLAALDPPPPEYEPPEDYTNPREYEELEALLPPPNDKP